MDVTVNPDELAKILTDVRLLIKDCLIPRLDKLEDDIREIKQFMWPVCSSFYDENSQLDNIEIKSKILMGMFLSPEDLKKLCELKKKMDHKINPKFPRDYYQQEEYHKILSYLLSHQSQQ